MQVKIPVRLLAPPTLREFLDDGQKRRAFVTTVMVGSDAAKLWSDEDPTASLNGSLAKVEAGDIISVVAVLRLYPRKTSGLGVALDHFEELEPLRASSATASADAKG